MRSGLLSVEDLGRHANYRMSLFLKISLCYLCVEEGMSLAGIRRMITDIQKYKNDNLFSVQVLGFLMFSNGRECDIVMTTVVLLICILP